jgi:CheY-like chemotaxis protein
MNSEPDKTLKPADPVPEPPAKESSPPTVPAAVTPEKESVAKIETPVPITPSAEKAAVPVEASSAKEPVAAAPAQTPATQAAVAAVPAKEPPTAIPAEEPAAAAPAPPKVSEAVVVDDEPANRDFLVRLLEQAKMKVHGASTGAEALQILKNVENLTLIVIDNKLPDVDGVELLCQLRPKYPAARMVMATMLDERSLMAKAFENGCDVFLVKPHGFMELFRRLQMPSLPGNEDNLKRLIIDQYGPRPYRG